MAKVFDVVATLGEYTVGGQTKKRYMNCGAVFQQDDGRMWMALDAVPTNKEWKGTFNFMEPRKQGGGQAPSRPAGGGQAPTSTKDFDDDIPF